MLVHAAPVAGEKRFAIGLVKSDGFIHLFPADQLIDVGIERRTSFVFLERLPQVFKLERVAGGAQMSETPVWADSNARPLLVEEDEERASMGSVDDIKPALDRAPSNRGVSIDLDTDSVEDEEFVRY